MLYVPGMRDRRLSIPTLQGEEYKMVFKSEHIFIYRTRVDTVDPVLIGHQRDGEYVVSGHPTSKGSRWIIGSDSKSENLQGLM